MSERAYSLEAEIEATRLEEQVFQRNYLIDEEMGNFHFSPNEVVLDAGCGTGVLSRYLVNHFNVSHVDAVDASELRIRQASELTSGDCRERITFKQQMLGRLDPSYSEKYDTVVCRYVLEHVDDPIGILRDLKGALKEGGRLIVMDLDGVFINLFSSNTKYNQYMSELNQSIEFDLNIGRKLPNYFHQVGMRSVDYKAELINCRGRRLEEEIDNTEKRLVALEDYCVKVFGSKARYEDFKKVYLEEMSKSQNTLMFTKVICFGFK